MMAVTAGVRINCAACLEVCLARALALHTATDVKKLLHNSGQPHGQEPITKPKVKHNTTLNRGSRRYTFHNMQDGLAAMQHEGIEAAALHC
jgi:hypothetical protein